MSNLITNGAEIKSRIITEINNAKQCIYVAMAYFTDRDIAFALVDAKNRNLYIDIILSSNSLNETVKLILKGAGINVHAFETGDARGLMHHKFCLIDNNILINGSYNYTINASNNNVENITVSYDKTIYSQFMTEFERLKYNIDNQISVNEPTTYPEIKTTNNQQADSIASFSEQLHSLVYSAAEIDTEKYRLQGYATSKECHGNIDIFRTEFNAIKEKIRGYATDEGLGSKKNILTSNISIAYESRKNDYEVEKEEKIAIEKRNNQLELRQLNDRITNLNSEKLLLESGNQITNEKGLLQINKEIEKNKGERKILEQSFIVKKFWNIGTILAGIGLVIFLFYLSVFFASAIYKVFFEGNVIRTALEAGLNPGIPQIVDANAIIKIFRQQGLLFGLIAALFFLIPILLSNLKILGSENKIVNNLLFWVGLLIFDIIVSTMVAKNTDEIKSLLIGKESTIKIWEVVTLGEFWLIFVFGMFPLILTHYLIEYLTKAYKNSQREIVDAEKYRKIQFLDEEMIDLNAEKDSIINKIKEKDDAIFQCKTRIQQLEIEFNILQTQIENKYSNYQKQIKSIYEDLNARITSGRIFTDLLLDSIISAYKSGFIEYLPDYYSSDEVANRVREIEQSSIPSVR